MGDPFAVGWLIGVEFLAFALALSETQEALARTFLADEATGEHQQIRHLDGQQAAVAGFGAQVMTDEAPGLPVFGYPRAREPGNPGEQQEVAGQRQHHAASQRVDMQADRSVQQDAQPGEAVQRPTHATCDERQYQGVEPQRSPHDQAGEHAAAVGLLPHQGAEHRGRQLADGGERDLADGRQAGAFAEQAIADVGQQQDQHDADPARREHPVAEGLERAFGALAAQQPGQQHVVGNHGRQGHCLDDDHAGSGRRPTNEGQHGQADGLRPVAG